MIHHQKGSQTMRHAVLFLLTCTIASSALAASNKREIRILRESAEVVEELMSTPDSSIPEDLLEKAECIGVFPRVKKGAFIVGGKYGRGVMSCRASDGRMDAPAFYAISGGSIGFQIGGSSTDIVMLVMNADGMKHLVADRFTLGGEATVAAGPVGRSTQAATDAQMQAEILSWSRARGLFAGVSLNGAAVAPSEDANERLYGEPTSARSILIEHSEQVPAAASRFIQVIRKHTAR